MWIIEWSSLSDYEFSVSAWVSEIEALKAACTSIINHINTLNYFQDDDLCVDAKAINNFIKAKKYREAVQHWNDCHYNESDPSPKYWTVRQLTPQPFRADVPVNIFPDEEKTNPSIIINNHTCTLCGNTKCSKQEASCWSCGNPIS